MAGKGLGEPIRCRCGCGGALTTLDERKRPREFLPGHHIRLEWAKRKKRK